MLCCALFYSPTLNDITVTKRNKINQRVHFCRWWKCLWCSNYCLEIDFRFVKARTKFVYRGHTRLRRKDPPPHGIKLTKGAVHILASREYVEYVIMSEVAQDFLAWVNDTQVPDETFFTSLNYNPQLGVPGSYAGWWINLAICID